MAASNKYAEGTSKLGKKQAKTAVKANSFDK
jgi:hypothetical protein